MTEHILKTWPEFFRAVKTGKKTFEMRLNDRNYQVGDVLILKEYEPFTEEFSGDYLIKKVTYLLGEPYTPDGYVIMALGDIGHSKTLIPTKLINTTDPQFLPSRKYPNDGGADLRARLDQPKRVYPHEIMKVPTGIAVEIPEGHVGLIQPRSGASSEGKLVITGTIDSNYRGEMLMTVANINDECYVVIQPLERMAQLVVVPVYLAEFELVDELSESDRGSKGFGSSGKY